MPPMIGQIILIANSFAPRGWLFCDGTALPISENDTLFQILGNTYGGDDDTFAVPDLRAAAPKNCNYCISLFGTFGTNVYQGIIGETLPIVTSVNSPGNLVECTGGTFTKAQFPVLGGYIGKKFGGDGQNTFGLPNLTGKFPASTYRYRIAVSGDIPEVSRTLRESFVSELVLLPMDQPVHNFLLCNGSLLPVSTNKALFAYIGNKFGGDDKEFRLPDLRGVPVANYNYYICAVGIVPPRP